MTDPIVTLDWLAAHLGDVVVLDATYFLPPDPARSRRDFEAERISGARLFEVDEIADKASDLPHMLPGAETFASAMAALGIDGSRPAVVYDRSPNHFSAPRVWFTLRLYGLAQSFVLDGGLAAWKEAGHPVESGPARTAGAARLNWRLDTSRVLTGREMAQRVAAGDAPILDGRATERFEGTAPEPRPGLRSGHMPGATCVPFQTLTGPDGRFATPDRLREIFSGGFASAPIVTCGSGMTACTLALGLERIGVAARLYDGSWAEWGTGRLGTIVS